MEEKNKSKEIGKSNLDFKMMSFMFKIRDFFKSPIGKIEKAGIKSGDIVLDYGCGPGSYSIAAAERVGVLGKVYAADIHPLAIKEVEEKAKKKKLTNIETIRTDCNTNIAANSVDIVTCFDVMHGLSNSSDVLKEFHRVLKPGARLSLDDHHYTESEIISKVTQNGWFKVGTAQDGFINFIKIE